MNDAVLGRLHTVGLAREYRVAGLPVSSPNERGGTRTDPDRERR